MRSALAFLLAFIFFSLIYSCQSSSNNTSQTKGAPKYFDLPAFFEQEATSLGSRKIQKTIRQDQKEETKEINLATAEQWRKEFTLLLKIQLNRPSFSDKYKIDSIFDPATKQLQLIRYTATQPEQLYTQSVDVYFDAQQKASSVLITNRNHNLISPTIYQLQYDRQKGYHIQQSQKLPFETATEIDISAVFID
jgi:hypothetical protein